MNFMDTDGGHMPVMSSAKLVRMPAQLLGRGKRL